MSSWLDDDPELLRAALEIVDNWDDVALERDAAGGESPQSDETDSSTERADSSDDVPTERRSESESTQPAKPRRAGKTSALKPSTVASTHHRRREEISYLRDTVQQMESQLEELRRTNAKRKAQTQEEEHCDKALAVMWRDMATRQQKLRQKAELDQAKLRNLLKAQVQVARGLMRYMEKARRIENDQMLQSMKKPRINALPDVPFQEDVQFAAVEMLYPRMDELFTFSKFHDGTGKFVDVQVTNDQSEGILIELRESWLLPFDAPQVLDALWEHTIKDHDIHWRQAGNKTSSRLTHNGTGLVYSFSVRAPMNGAECHHDGQGVVRRFSGERGQPSAIISNMETCPAVNSTIESSGVYVKESMCIRIQPQLPSEEKPFTRAMTRVQYRQQFHVTFDNDDCPGRQQSELLTEIILGKINFDVERKHNTVETLLLRPSSQSFDSSTSGPICVN